MWQAMAKNQDKPEDDSLRQQIDENLRRVYEQTLNEDVPDRFRELLDQLRRKTVEK